MPSLPPTDKVSQAVKRAVTKRLAEEGIDKAHPEFKPIFQMCYQGVSFALVRVLYSYTFLSC